MTFPKNRSESVETLAPELRKEIERGLPPMKEHALERRANVLEKATREEWERGTQIQ